MMGLISILLTCLSVCGVGTYLYYYLAKKRRRREWAACGRVVVHCPPPGALTPCVSPFAVKLVTYLRMAGIPYQLDHTEPLWETWLTPWITLEGGEELGDSGVVVARLQRRGGAAHPSSGLSASRSAVARALMVMVEDHLTWCLRVWRIKVDAGRNLFEGATSPPSWYVRLGLPLYVWLRSRTLNQQGIGRLPHAIVQRAVWEDLNALSGYLGDKLYLMGQDMMEVDCTVFAQMVNILYNYRRSPYATMLRDEFPNLVQYVDRIKGKIWPDWDDCLAH